VRVRVRARGRVRGRGRGRVTSARSMITPKERAGRRSVATSS